MLENELASIVEKINFLRMLYQSKKEMENNYKSHFPKAHLNFVEEEMRGVEENLDCAPGIVETELAWLSIVLFRSTSHVATDEIVGQEIGPHFFANHFRGQTTHLFHSHHGLHCAKIEFTMPSFAK